MAVGMAVAASGYLLLTQVDAATPALLVIGWTVALGGAGLPAGLAIGLIIGAAPAEKAGSASSLSETCTEFGLALGIATIGSLATAVYRGGLDLPPGTQPEVATATTDGITGALAAAARAPEVLAPAREAYTAGLNVATGLSAVLSLALVIVTARLFRQIPAFGRTTEDTPAEAMAGSAA